MSDPIRPTDEGMDGGKYVNEQGFWINAEGQFIDERGNVVDKPVKANQPKPDSRPAKTDEPVKPAFKPTEK